MASLRLQSPSPFVRANSGSVRGLLWLSFGYWHGSSADVCVAASISRVRRVWLCPAGPDVPTRAFLTGLRSLHLLCPICATGLRRATLRRSQRRHASALAHRLQARRRSCYRVVVRCLRLASLSRVVGRSTSLCSWSEKVGFWPLGRWYSPGVRSPVYPPVIPAMADTHPFRHAAGSLAGVGRTVSEAHGRDLSPPLTCCLLRVSLSILNSTRPYLLCAEARARPHLATLQPCPETGLASTSPALAACWGWACSPHSALRSPFH